MTKMRVINTGEWITRTGPRIFRFYAKNQKYSASDLNNYLALVGYIHGKDQGYLNIKPDEDFPLIFKHTVEEQTIGLF